MNRLWVVALFVALFIAGCGEPGESQPVNISVPLSIQSFPVIEGTNIRPVLKVDGASYTSASENNGVIEFQLELSSDVVHTFSLEVYASRLSQFVGEVTVATIPSQTYYISQSDPTQNNITLKSFEFNYNDDNDLLNNWDEIKLGYNPLLKETSLNPSYIYDNTSNGQNNDGALSIAATKDGGWVVAGFTTKDAADDMAVWKFNAQGNLDTSFANNGVYINNNASPNPSDNFAADVAALPDGGWVVVGDLWDAKFSDMAVWKFTANGELDNTFGVAGVFTHDGAAGGNKYDTARGVCVFADGGWIVTGFSNNSVGNYDMALWKFTANGELDTSFDTDGIFSHHNAAGGNLDDFGRGCALTPDGGWVVVGNSHRSGALDYDMVVWKFNAAGVLDSNFGNGGVFTQNGAAGGNGNDVAYRVEVSPSNEWLVIGYSDNAQGNHDMALWKFLADGTLDSNFGNNGAFIHNSAAGGSSDDVGYGIARTNDGGWLAVGYSNNATATLLDARDMTMWKFDANGQLDHSFGKNGIYSKNNVAGGNALDMASDLIVRPNGEWVVVGQSSNGALNYDAVVW